MRPDQPRNRSTSIPPSTLLYRSLVPDCPLSQVQTMTHTHTNRDRGDGPVSVWSRNSDWRKRKVNWLFDRLFCSGSNCFSDRRVRDQETHCTSVYRLKPNPNSIFFLNQNISQILSVKFQTPNNVWYKFTSVIFFFSALTDWNRMHCSVRRWIVL